MAAQILYHFFNIAMIITVLVLMKLLYDRLEMRENRVLFVGCIGLVLDLSSNYALALSSSFSVARFALVISICGRFLICLGYVFYMDKVFNSKYTMAIFAFWLVSIIGAFAHSLIPGESVYLANRRLANLNGFSILIGERGYIYFFHLFAIYVIGIWGILTVLHSLRAHRGRYSGNEIPNSLFYIFATLVQGVSCLVYELNYGQVINFIPIARAFSTGVYVVLSIKYNIINYDTLARQTLMDNIGAGFFVLSDKFKPLYANEVALKLFPSLKDPKDDLKEIKSVIQKNECQYTHNGSFYRITADRMFSNGKLSGYSVLIVDISDIVALENQAEVSQTSRKNLLTNLSHEIRTPLNVITGASEMMRKSGLSESEYREYAEVVRMGTANLNEILEDILTATKENEVILQDDVAPYSICTLISNVVAMCNERALNKKVRFSVSIADDIPVNAMGDDRRVRQVLLNVLSGAIRYTDVGAVSLGVDGEYLKDERFEYTYTIMDTSRNVFRAVNDYEDLSSSDELGVDYSSGYGISLIVAKRIVKALDGSFFIKSIPGKGNIYSIRIPSQILEKRTLSDYCIKEKMSVYFCGEDSDNLSNLRVACRELGVPFEYYPGLGKTRKLSCDNSRYNVLLFDYVKYGKRVSASEKAKDYTKIAILNSGNLPDEYNRDFIFVRPPMSVLTLLSIFLECEDRAEAVEEVSAFTAPSAKVLVVDDNIINLEIARTMLEQFEVSVDTADSGYKCLDIIREGRKYDLIFMDYMMEGMDGIEATKKIREMTTPIKDVPIIAFTANAVDGAEEKYILGGMNGCIFKPANTKAFGDALKKYLPRRMLVFEKKSSQEANDYKPEDFPLIEGIDRNQAAKYCGGNLEIYREMLGTFSKETEKKISEILSYANKDDLKNFTVLVHGVKGLARTLGITKLSESMALLEKAGNGEDSAYIKANLSEVLSLYSRWGKILSPYAVEKEKEYANIDGDKVGETLLKMMELLEDFEMDDAEELFREIWPAEYDEIKEPLMLGLKDSIERVDYYASKDYIEKLLETYRKEENV